MCDKHIPKMIIESAQMLASALRRHGATDSDMPLTQKGTPFGNAHPNHPCTKWVGDSKINYAWLLNHAYGLLLEYQDRFRKKHATSTAIYWMGDMDRFIPWGKDTEFVQAMPEQYKQNCPVEAYRAYYQGEKKSFAKWERGTPKPHWYNI